MANMGTRQVIRGVVNHSHRDRIGNSVLFNKILETLGVLIGKDLNINVPSASIRNFHFLDVVSYLARKDICGLNAQK